MAETEDIMIATRVSKQLHAQILKRQRTLKQLTGIKPSVSAVVRSMIAEATLNDEMPRRRVGGKRRPAASERAA